MNLKIFITQGVAIALVAGSVLVTCTTSTFWRASIDEKVSRIESVISSCDSKYRLALSQ